MHSRKINRFKGKNKLNYEKNYTLLKNLEKLNLRKTYLFVKPDNIFKLNDFKLNNIKEFIFPLSFFFLQFS